MFDTLLSFLQRFICRAWRYNFFNLIIMLKKF